MKRPWAGSWLWLAALLMPVVAAGAAEFEMVAPGAYVLSGAALAAEGVPAEVGNVGLLVGEDAALLFDTGASYRQGHAVLTAQRRVTDRPPRLALISHPLPEFLFGATALQDAGIRVVAHPHCATLIAQRCHTCLEHAIESYGADAMAGTRVPVPDSGGEGGWTVDLGGRQVEVLDFGWASAPGNLAVLDRASGTLYAGGLIAVDRVPMLRDADLDGWVAALDRIVSLPVRRIVPGHGPVVTVEAVAALRAYLVALDAEVRRLYANGASLSESVDVAALPAYAGWAGYAEVHRQNVHYRYLALERADFDAATRRPPRRSGSGNGRRCRRAIFGGIEKRPRSRPLSHCSESAALVSNSRLSRARSSASTGESSCTLRVKVQPVGVCTNAKPVGASM